MNRYIAVFLCMTVLAVAGVRPGARARTLDKKEDAEPVMRLIKEQEKNRSKEVKEIELLQKQIEVLISKIAALDGRITEIKDAHEMKRNMLDELHALVIKKEGLQKDLKGKEEDLREKQEDHQEKEQERQESLDALRAEMKKDQRKQRATTLKQDVRKFKKIVKSPAVRSMEIDASAWEALAAKYPEEAKGVVYGDIAELEFRVKYGGMTNSMGMRFVLVPAGSFRMGSRESETFRSADETRHKVTIKRPFYLQTTEVTQMQWKKLMGKNPSEFDTCGKDCPVENVSWEECRAFIRKLNELEGADKYRLPTEAEWEYACRGGRGTPFSAGDLTVTGCGLDPVLHEIGWYCANSGRRTHPVALKEKNAFGLYDMHGNVWEWCQDWYGAYPSGAVVDPEGRPYGPCRVIRGGSCLNFSEKCRAAYRYSYRPFIKMKNIGFRVARTK